MNILVVDDEQMQRTMLQRFLEKQGYRVVAAACAEDALRLFMKQPIELALLDHRMPDMNGDELLARLKDVNPMLKVIMITAFGTVDTAVRVMQLGADDFLEKPVDLSVLLDKIRHLEEKTLVDRDADEVEDAMDTDTLPVRMVARSAVMKNLLSMTLRAAPTPWTVMVKGETGTGKELIARMIHLLSPRKDSPFIELNCAAVPENLFESELFGHEKGSFTGAAARRRGLFEQAHGGTLLLDEVGELPLSTQAKLLRALQEDTITRVGGEQSVPVDVRIIAATNRDLKLMVGKGEFREDLFFRINVIELEIPPLRQRKEDLPPLIDFFLNKFNSRAVFDSESLAQLAKYNFPGNVRELEHIIQRTITLARSSAIRLTDLPAEVRNFSSACDHGTLNKRLAEMERQMILEALEANNWVQTRAAETLGISERVLRYKMDKGGITKKRP